MCCDGAGGNAYVVRGVAWKPERAIHKGRDQAAAGPLPDRPYAASALYCRECEQTVLAPTPRAPNPPQTHTR